MAISIFSSRDEAGHRLAEKVKGLGLVSPVVLALPKTGLPVARALAKSLESDLGIAPAPEAEMAESTEFSSLTADQQEKPVGTDPKGRDVLLVDDGMITGRSALAAIRALQGDGAGRIVVACAIATNDVVKRVRDASAEIVVLRIDDELTDVSRYFVEYETVSDEEVEKVRESAKVGPRKGAAAATQDMGRDQEIVLDLGGEKLNGTLVLPANARGVVLFAHGSGSSRHSPRNQAVARALNHEGFATLLLDLLTEKEAQDRNEVFDIHKLARRVRQATEWLAEDERTADFRVGYFGASTGAAAALEAAASIPERVSAVVSRGGRPDLAMSFLPMVLAPTLLIVGEEDKEVITLNRKALDAMECEKAMLLVPGASHLFEEPGTLEEVTRTAMAWFKRFLAPIDGPRETSSFDQPAW